MYSEHKENFSVQLKLLIYEKVQSILLFLNMLREKKKNIMCHFLEIGSVPFNCI